MKMKKGHYRVLEREINRVLKDYPLLVSEYESGEFPRSDKVKDLNTRFCWDLLSGCGIRSFVIDTLYLYLDDSHILTALRKIVPEIERKY